MTLPKLEHPLFTEIIPSTKKKISLRPMLVKEEKILLMAKESKDTNAIVLAIKQVVNNCVVANGFDVNKLTMFDLDYLFIKVRAASVNNTIKLSYIDEDDEPVKKKQKDGSYQDVMPTYDFDVDLNEVTVKWPDEKVESTIKIDNDSGLKLKYPDVSVYDNPALASAANADEIVQVMITSSFDSYFKGDKVYSFKDESKEAISEFIDNLDVATYGKVVNFFQNMPTVYYEVKFKNSKGEEKTQTLSKLTDFFTF